MSSINPPTTERKSGDSDTPRPGTPLQQAQRKALLQFFIGSGHWPRRLDNVFYCELETNGMTREMVNEAINDLVAQGRIELIPNTGVVHAQWFDAYKEMSEDTTYEGCGH